MGRKHILIAGYITLELLHHILIILLFIKLFLHTYQHVLCLLKSAVTLTSTIYVLPTILASRKVKIGQSLCVSVPSFLVVDLQSLPTHTI